MPKPIVLHPFDTTTDPVEVPEVLYISALLDTGAFTPETHGVTAEHLAAYNRVFDFCCDYQNHARSAPDVDLVQRKFPDFPYVPKVNPTWAAGQLLDADYSRSYRRTVRDGLNAINNGDLSEAAGLLSALTIRPITSGPFGLSNFAPENVEESAPKVGLPVPWQTLWEATEGIGFNELWYWAARPGTGKTMTATGIAAGIAEAGYVTHYITCEMPAWKINRRVNLHLARNDPGLQNMLRSADEGQRREAIQELEGRVAGRVVAIDQRHMKMSVANIPMAAKDAHLVVVDHVGLLYSADGRRAVEDWRVMQEITNTMVEQKGQLRIGILGMVQIGRTGEVRGTNAPPMSAMRQSQALEEDGDIVVTMARPNEGTVMVNQIRKNRDRPAAKWFSRYLPGPMNFEEINVEQARAQLDIDKDAFADWN